MTETPSVATVAVTYHPGFAAMYAGLGAAAGFLCYLAILDFFSSTFDNILALAISILIIVLFIEPLIHRTTLPLNFEEVRHANPRAKLAGRSVLFGVLAVTALSHHLVDDIVTKNSSGAAGILLAALLLPGGITFLWFLGARRRPPSAAANGLLGGIILGVSFFLLLFVLTNARAVTTDASGHAIFVEMPFENAEMSVVFNAMPWALFGLFGGLAMDRRWGKRPAVGVPATLIALVVLLDGAVKVFEPDILFSMGSEVARIAGWAAGVWLYISEESDPTELKVAIRLKDDRETRH